LDAIAATVRKNHRVIVAYEDMLSWALARKLPRALLTSFSRSSTARSNASPPCHFCAYQPKLEDVILPQTEHLVSAVKQLLEY